MEERLLKVKEISEYLGVSQYTVRKWLREEKIKGIKIGMLWRVHQKDLEAFLEAKNEARLLTTKEAAEDLGIKLRTLQNMIQKGELKARISPHSKRKAYLIPKDEVERLKGKD